MRVVIESTPAESARVFVVRRKLVMHACVPVRVLAQALDVVIAFGRIHVAVEFGVEIKRMIWRTQGKTKIVHGENIFEPF